MFKWEIEVCMYGGKRKWIAVETQAEDWYEVENYCLSQPGVWDVGEHYRMYRPDGSFEFV